MAPECCHSDSLTHFIPSIDIGINWVFASSCRSEFSFLHSLSLSLVHRKVLFAPSIIQSWPRASGRVSKRKKTIIEFNRRASDLFMLSAACKGEKLSLAKWIKESWRKRSLRKSSSKSNWDKKTKVLHVPLYNARARSFRNKLSTFSRVKN